MELFLYGDPRLLAGGEGGSRPTRDSYEYDPPIISGKGHSTASLEKIAKVSFQNGLEASRILGSTDEVMHRGKSGYHSNIAHNKFLVDGQWPSAGIELETISSKYDSSHTSRLVDDLRSNWFHFERDGSLDDEHGGEYGYELITEPLPPRVYRNPNTWVGLENILSPWLESFDHSCTGLHVHVGLNQFMDFDMPIRNRQSRLYIGKLMSMLVYYAVADAAFVDRVCLRKQTRFCGTPRENFIFEGTSRLATGEMTGYEFIDMAIGKLIRQDMGRWSNDVSRAAGHVNDTTDVSFCMLNLCGATSHGTEVNTEHKYTIEFRRGKGTLHALSIHRIVELMTMIVRYAGKCCRNPDDKVSTKAFYEFVHDNTTSVPLKKLIEKATTAK